MRSRTPYLAFCVIFLTGCAGSSQDVTLPVWQKGVEKYVTDFGKGDPTSLRDMKLPDGRKGFAVIGDPIPSRSKDASGVLVGHRQIAGKPTFIYLVGLVNEEKLENIRVVLVSIDGGQFHWTVGPANPGSLETYRQYKERLWKGRFPGRQTAPPEYSNFPGEGDVFSLTDAGGRLAVVHEQSKATWLAQ